jgi:hypothetical protein
MDTNILNIIPFPLFYLQFTFKALYKMKTSICYCNEILIHFSLPCQLKAPQTTVISNDNFVG